MSDALDYEVVKRPSQVKERIFKYFTMACAGLGIVAVLFICIYLLVTGCPAIAEIGVFKFIFGSTWRPSEGVYGILPMIVNTLYVTAFAILFGVVIGIFAAIFLSRFCPKKLKSVLRQAVNLLSGIPSVIYGFFGITVIVPFFGRFMDNGSGYGVLASGIVLGIMILPTVISISLTSLDNVPQSYYEGAVALGATHSQAVFSAVVPAAKSGIVAASVLGITRAIGETMAIVMVCGNSTRFASSLFEGIRTMTANIVAEMGYAVTGSLHYRALIATGVVLFIFVLIITLSLNLLSNRKPKYHKNKTKKLKSGANYTPDQYRIKRGASVVLRVIATACMSITVISLAFIVLYILISGIPNLTPQLLFGNSPYGGEPTILPALVATVEMIVFSIVIAVPIGIATAIYLCEYTKRGSKIVRAVRLCLETLSGIPSIIYALFGMLVFCEMFGMGKCILAASFTLSIMILPVIVRTTEEALREVPDSYREAGYALGASKCRVIFTAVLPNALPGIITSVILAMGRVLGESAAVLFTAGSTVFMPSSPMSSAPSLALYVYLLSIEGTHMAEAYGVSCVVLLLAVFLNVLATFVGRKRKIKVKPSNSEKAVGASKTSESVSTANSQTLADEKTDIIVKSEGIVCSD